MNTIFQTMQDKLGWYRFISNEIIASFLQFNQKGTTDFVILFLKKFEGQNEYNLVT